MSTDTDTDIAIPPARLKAMFEDEVRPKLQEEFGYSSPMQHPRIEKITLNMGVGDAKVNSKFLDEAVEQMGQIAGQKPAITRARNGPTLTQVPVASLKSSAMRPSNMSPWPGSPESMKRTASPLQ